MISNFLKATPEQIKALGMLTLILLSVIFWPAIQWGTSLVIRRNHVRSDQVEAAIPLRWVAAEDSSRVQAWSLCLTMFCSAPRSSLQLQVEDRLRGKKDAWLSSAERVFSDRRFSSHLMRSFSSPAGNVQCLESVSELRREVVDSACFASESGMVASFEGVHSDLDDFYKIVASAKIAKAK